MQTNPMRMRQMRYIQCMREENLRWKILREGYYLGDPCICGKREGTTKMVVNISRMIHKCVCILIEDQGLCVYNTAITSIPTWSDDCSHNHGFQEFSNNTWIRKMCWICNWDFWSTILLHTFLSKYSSCKRDAFKLKRWNIFHLNVKVELSIYDELECIELTQVRFNCSHSSSKPE